MKHNPRHNSTKQVSLAGVSGRRMTALLKEREQLREEVKQLSASVQIYAEIVRRLQSQARRRAA